MPATKIDQPAILAAIEKRHRAFAGAQWGILLIGIPLTIVGPFFMTIMIWFAAGMFGYWWPWLTVFGIVTTAFVPILFWYAARGSSNMLVEAAQSGSTSTSTAMWAIARRGGGGALGSVASLAAVAASPRASAAGFQEIFLTGPRQIVKAFRKIRVMRSLKNARHDRAAEILTILVRQDRGVEVAKTLRPGEKEEDVWDELAFLMFHDWIGLSEDAKRAWVLTDAKRTLGLK